MSLSHRLRCWAGHTSHATATRTINEISRHEPTGLFANDLASEVSSLATTRVELEMPNLFPQEPVCDLTPDGLVACDGPGGIGEVKDKKCFHGEEKKTMFEK